MDINILKKVYGRMDDKISIIVPVYNRDKYISSCLDSIFNQSVPIDFIEVICVDDNSTDRTLSILKEYEEKYSDNLLLVMCNENSCGYIGKVRNIGMQYASGNYIVFVDSDDYLDKNFIEKMYIGAIVGNSEVVASSYRLFNDNGIIGEGKKSEIIYRTELFDSLQGLYYTEGTEGYVWGKLYSKQFLIENNIVFRENLKLAEDTNFHEQVLRNVNRYYTLGDCLYYYRINNESACNASTSYIHGKDCIDVQLESYDYYRNHSRTVHLEQYGKSLDQIYAYKMCSAICYIKKLCYRDGMEQFYNENYMKYEKMLWNCFEELNQYDLVMRNDYFKKHLFDEK